MVFVNVLFICFGLGKMAAIEQIALTPIRFYECDCKTQGSSTCLAGESAPFLDPLMRL